MCQSVFWYLLSNVFTRKVFAGKRKLSLCKITRDNEGYIEKIYIHGKRRKMSPPLIGPSKYNIMRENEKGRQRKTSTHDK